MAPKLPFASDLNANVGDFGLTLLTQAHEEGVPFVVVTAALLRSVLEVARDIQATAGRIYQSTKQLTAPLWTTLCRSIWNLFMNCVCARHWDSPPPLRDY